MQIRKPFLRDFFTPEEKKNYSLMLIYERRFFKQFLCISNFFYCISEFDFYKGHLFIFFLYFFNKGLTLQKVFEKKFAKKIQKVNTAVIETVVLDLAVWDNYSFLIF